MGVIAITAIAAYIAVLVSIISCFPYWINDENAFLRNFVNHEFLNTIGIILAITIASLGQIHLSINQIEEKRQKRILEFKGVRKEIHSSARWLIGLFLFSVIIVVTKPLVGQNSQLIALFNGLALLVLLFYVFILIDIVGAIFTIEPDTSEKK